LAKSESIDVDSLRFGEKVGREHSREAKSSSNHKLRRKPEETSSPSSVSHVIRKRKNTQKLELNSRNNVRGWGDDESFADGNLSSNTVKIGGCGYTGVDVGNQNRPRKTGS